MSYKKTIFNVFKAKSLLVHLFVLELSVNKDATGQEASDFACLLFLLLFFHFLFVVVVVVCFWNSSHDASSFDVPYSNLFFQQTNGSSSLQAKTILLKQNKENKTEIALQTALRPYSTLKTILQYTSIILQYGHCPSVLTAGKRMVSVIQARVSLKVLEGTVQ